MSLCKSCVSDLNNIANHRLSFDSAGQTKFGFKLLLAHKPHVLYVLQLKMHLIGIKHPIER